MGGGKTKYHEKGREGTSERETVMWQIIWGIMSRLEKVNLRSLRSMAKVIGTIICVGGAISMAFFKGPKLLNADYHNLITLLHSVTTNGSQARYFSLAAVLDLLCASKTKEIKTSNICIFILPGATLQIVSRPVIAVGVDVPLIDFSVRYTHILPVTGFECLENYFSYRTLRLHIRGKVYLDHVLPTVSKLGVYQKGGPCILQCLIPLHCNYYGFAFFVLHEELHIGSLIGAIAVVGGLYVVLWGKAEDLNRLANSYDGRTKIAIIVDARHVSGESAVREPLIAEKAQVEMENEYNKATRIRKEKNRTEARRQLYTIPSPTLALMNTVKTTNTTNAPRKTTWIQQLDMRREGSPLRISSFPSAVAVRIVAPNVPECAASDRVDDDEEDEDDDIYDGDLLPVLLDVGEHAGLAGLAAIAEGRRVVVPRRAVGVVGRAQCRGVHSPHSWTHIVEVAFGGRQLYLNRGEIVPDELIEGLVALLEPLANLRVLQAAPDLGPVLGVVDALLEPVGVVAEAVLLEPAVGDGLAGALVGDEEGEEGEGEEEEDEEEHGEEVEPEEEGGPAAGADEAGDGDEHEEGAEDDERHREEALALGAGPAAAGGEPHAAAEHGHGEEEGEEVEHPDEVVAEPKHRDPPQPMPTRCTPRMRAR
ncbi:WAT1-related protein [Ananas comosus]|uniref:WAT1-related protein n=1 Tax=Ananas comosus TaxID=4615 RepID=A0A199VG59_ANACO|nr:WAT1-related protein [Ananas comosus]